MHAVVKTESEMMKEQHHTSMFNNMSEQEVSIKLEAHMEFSSSCEFDEYVNTIPSLFVSSSIKSQIKRIRRMIKNREAANLSRKKKKARLEEVTEQLASLQIQKQQYDEQLKHLSSHHIVLSTQLSLLSSIVKDSPTLSAAFLLLVSSAATNNNKRNSISSSPDSPRNKNSSNSPSLRPVCAQA
eukprot:TRINITY_DN2564_c0_g1_i1.p1 TRINITY_DN2564_c0_g1~~TRINITY_DN2564_c0_g1_i1.p1  ORF type:complete len:184 (+),score=56.30 TRINITY_DN2564_c0_g1_i1:120-671(+)